MNIRTAMASCSTRVRFLPFRKKSEIHRRRRFDRRTVRAAERIIDCEFRPPEHRPKIRSSRGPKFAGREAQHPGRPIRLHRDRRIESLTVSQALLGDTVPRNGFGSLLWTPSRVELVSLTSGVATA